jgi:hypothetical protein
MLSIAVFSQFSYCCGDSDTRCGIYKAGKPDDRTVIWTIESKSKIHKVVQQKSGRYEQHKWNIQRMPNALIKYSPAVYLCKQYQE